MKDKHSLYMDMAKVWSKNSKAKRRKVGALIVLDGNIISDGYNGTPHKFDNNCEWRVKNEYVSKPEVLHAESNAITKLAKSTQSSDGATLYVTTAPCFDCAKLIIQAGIKKVYWQDEYRNVDGLILLKRANIHTKRIKYED